MSFDDESSPSGWNLLESDPHVFSSLLRDIGVQGLEVDDLYSLDADTLKTLEPIHALIFLFKWVGGDRKEGLAGGELIKNEEDHLGVYFANQVVNDACGTIASLNAVMNIPPQESEKPEETIAHGAELSNLREFGMGMSAVDLGHLITNSDLIRTVHNSFSSSSPFSISHDPSISRPKQDAYHFITYVPVQGSLWELDGLKEGPVRHGAVPEGQGWLDVAREVVQKRIEEYPAGSLMFSLLCIRSAPIPRLQRLLKTSPDPTLQAQLEQELAKARRGELENGLRRANLIPMVIECIKALAKSKTSDGQNRLELARDQARTKKQT